MRRGILQAARVLLERSISSRRRSRGPSRTPRMLLPGRTLAASRTPLRFDPRLAASRTPKRLSQRQKCESLEVSGVATLLETEMAKKSALPEGKSRRALVRLWQKEKKARGPAISPDTELGRGCLKGDECVPDLTPEKSCRALIRMKRRELTRRQVDVGRRCLNDASGRARDDLV